MSAGGEGVCGVTAGGAEARLDPGALCSAPIGAISASSGGRDFRLSIDFFFRNIGGRMLSDELVVAVVAVVATESYLIEKVVVRDCTTDYTPCLLYHEQSLHVSAPLRIVPVTQFSKGDVFGRHDG